MGLDHGFQLFFPRHRASEVIEAIGAWQWQTGDEQTKGPPLLVTCDGQTKEIPVALWHKDHRINLDVAEESRERFALWLPFDPDAALLDYARYEAQQRFGSHEKVTIRSIDLWIHTAADYELGHALDVEKYPDLDLSDQSIFDPDLVLFYFRARTNCVSHVLAQSPSVRRGFVSLLQQHGGVCGFFHPGGGAFTLIWLDGQEYDFEIEDGWMPVDEIRQITTGQISHGSKIK